MLFQPKTVDEAPAARAGLRANSRDLAKAARRVGEQHEAIEQAKCFGMDPQELKAQRDTVDEVFQWQFETARDRRDAKATSKHYKLEATTDEQGNPEEFEKLVRIKPARIERFMDGQAERGKKVQAGVNRLGQRARELTGMPRKTGSSYLTDQGTQPLLNPEKTIVQDYSVAGQFAAKLANGIAVASEGVGDPGVVAATDVLTFGAPVLAVADAMASMDAVLKLHCERDKAKADLLRCPEEARQFWERLEDATPQEAEAFLRFEAAAEKLLHTTQEDRSTMAAATDRALRLAVVQPVAVGAAAGIEIAAHAAGSNPLLATVAPGLGMISGALHVHEGTHERLRRLDQQRRAEQRKDAMSKVLEANVDHPEFALLDGIVGALGGHQDRLIRQAKREKGFAKVRAGYGGASIGAGAALIAAAIVAPLALGPAAPIAAGPAFILGPALAIRNHKRVRAEHRSKWRQWAMRVLGFEMSRQALEAKLAGTHEKGPGLLVEFQEGDYLPEERRFAGDRKMEFDARKNEYLGLHVLALRVQDLVESKGGYDASSPFIQLLDAVGIDAIRLLAICKAASAKPANARLDFIQSQLAPALGMKLRVEGGGVQKLPHVSVFQRHYEAARSAAMKGLEKIPSDWEAKIRSQLAALYPDPEAGLLAFDAAIETFLARAKDLPRTTIAERIFMGELEGIVGLTQEDKEKIVAVARARQKFEGLRKAEDRKAEMVRQAEARKEDEVRERASARQKFEGLLDAEDRKAEVVRQAKARHVGDLLNQLEQFRDSAQPLRP